MKVPMIPVRAVDSHKGTYGRVLVIAGSRGMSGAAVLTGSAALRSGAGLVTVACPEAVQDIVAMGNACYTTFGFSELASLVELAAKCDVIAIGPGLGLAPETATMVRTIIDAFPAKPIVLDADGLMNLLPLPESIRTRATPIVMTPHPGEFARLTGRTASEIAANREAFAVEFATQYRVVLLLKGHRTIVADGTQLTTNETGNPGMATGGTGDVLTGVIAAFIGQGFSPFDAAVLGAHVHGRAGDLAAEVLGMVSLIASDLLDYLPQAIRERQISPPEST